MLVPVKVKGVSCVGRELLRQRQSWEMKMNWQSLPPYPPSAVVASVSVAQLPASTSLELSSRSLHGLS